MDAQKGKSMRCTEIGRRGAVVAVGQVLQSRSWLSLSTTHIATRELNTPAPDVNRRRNRDHTGALVLLPHMVISICLKNTAWLLLTVPGRDDLE
jgi:hypothetical protein